MAVQIKVPALGSIDRRPEDIVSSDGRILTRGVFEVELADEYAGIKDRFYNREDPTDRRVLTLNVYAIAPDHKNGCGRVLFPGASTPTHISFDVADHTVALLVRLTADRLEELGLSPTQPPDLDNLPDMSPAIVQLAQLAPEWILT